MSIVEDVGCYTLRKRSVPGDNRKNVRGLSRKGGTLRSGNSVKHQAEQSGEGSLRYFKSILGILILLIVCCGSIYGLYVINGEDFKGKLKGIINKVADKMGVQLYNKSNEAMRYQIEMYAQ